MPPEEGPIPLSRHTGRDGGTSLYNRKTPRCNDLITSDALLDYITGFRLN